MKTAILLYEDFTALDAIGTREYDPQPPFASGSPRSASPATVSFVQQIIMQEQKQK